MPDQPATTSDDRDPIREESWKQVIRTFAAAYVFEHRTRLLRRQLCVLRFLGIAVPASIGGIVAAVGTDSGWTGVSLVVGGIVGLIQLVLSIWSLASKWDDRFAYALESAPANYRLSERFQDIGRNPPNTVQDTKMQYDLIDVEATARSDRDIRQGVTDDEKRMGMRAALRELHKECVGCHKVPTSMTATDCDICGNFKLRRFCP